MAKYLVINNYSKYPQNQTSKYYVVYTIEGAERDKEKEKSWEEGIEVYELHEGQEFIISCIQNERYTDDDIYGYAKIIFKIKYLVKDNKAIPIEVYNFSLSAKEDSPEYGIEEKADWKKQTYYYMYDDIAEEKVEQQFFGEEAKEEILKILSEKFVFYLMEPDEMSRKNR